MEPGTTGQEEQTQYLNYFKKLGYNNIAVFNSGEELLEKMPSLDLLFLDIEMNKISGILWNQVLLGRLVKRS